MNSSQEIREAQRKTWNKFSGGWKKWDTFVMAWLRPVGAALLSDAQLATGHTVLDIATGTGEPGLSAAKMVAPGKVTGIDLAEDMVAIANERANSLGVTNYNAATQDATQLPYADAAFQAVIMRFGIMFFPDPPAALREIKRVLALQGKVSLAVWNAPDRNKWASLPASIVNRELNAPSPAPDAPGIFRYANIQPLQIMAAECGLALSDVREVTGSVGFDSAAEYWGFVTDVIAPVANALAGATDSQREKIKQEVLTASESLRSGDQIVFPFSAWVLSGGHS